VTKLAVSLNLEFMRFSACDADGHAVSYVNLRIRALDVHD